MKDYYDGWDVPYLASENTEVFEMIRLAGIKPGDSVVDLGCGQGNIILPLALRSDIQITGIENDHERALLCKTFVRFFGLENVKIHEKDLWEVSLSRFNVIFSFPMPGNFMNSLEEKIKDEAKKGTRIVLNTYAFNKLEPEPKSLVRQRWRNIYLYKI